MEQPDARSNADARLRTQIAACTRLMTIPATSRPKSKAKSSRATSTIITQFSCAPMA